MSFIESRSRRWKEEGGYFLALRLITGPLQRLRNRMLAAQLGVNQIHIGPGSILRGLCALQIGERFTAGRDLWLEAILRYNDQTFSPTIRIGHDVVISSGTHIAATNYVEIGDNVLIGSNVMITDHNHGQYSGPHVAPDSPPNLRALDSDRKVVIGKNVWLGNGVVLTPGSEVGEGSVIGANSVVTTSIPSFTIAAGIPARPLKRYDFEINEWVRL